ncbi:hypothetical protein HY947_03375 [Candidatus Gottesmanbacteria bacterium]|nr:hypothetical protein [Candidatus Gottesmanbacteria bacterium]
MQNFFIAISSVLALISYIVYAIAILKGEAKPHRTTRFVIVVIASLAFSALVASASTVAIWLIGSMTLGSIIIFLLSLKYGMGGFSKIDILCLFVSLGGIVAWKLTANPLFGIIASIAADLAGQIPMLIKTYKYPESEVWTFYALDVLAAIASLLAIQQWSFQELAYPLYITFLDFTVVLLILRKR